MKILMLTQRLPYAPNRGDRRRAYHLLRYLQARHEVHLVSLVHDEDEERRAGAMQGLAASVRVARCGRVRSLLRGAAGLAGSRPLTHLMLDSPALHPILQDVAARVQPDLVLAYGSGMARFAVEPPLSGIPYLLDLVDVDSDKWRAYAASSLPPLSWVYRREARLLGAFEARAARGAAATLVVNERELEGLRALAPDARAIVVPNGIDLDEWQSPRPPATAERVLFCGVMDYRPNHEGAMWFLREVWPRVRAERPHATAIIVGTSPKRALVRLAATLGVEVTGHVEDVRPYYWDSAVFVAPLQIARGVQNKVLDAAAAGVPSVVTTAVFEGLPHHVRDACLVGDGAGEFASCVVDCLERGAQRHATVRSLDLDSLSWPRRLEGLLDVLADVPAPSTN